MIKSGFFNSVEGDRLYNAEDMSSYYKGLIKDGVLNGYGKGLVVTSNSDMTVTIGKGRAYIDGKYLELTADESLTIKQSSTIQNRYTAIVLRKDDDTRDVKLITKDGIEAAETPPYPEMENNSRVTELCLAMVYVRRLTEKIEQADITDMRPSNLCGWVTGLIQFLSTDDLFLQWKNAYDTYYKDSTEEFTTWSAEKKQAFLDWYSTLTEHLMTGATLKNYKSVHAVAAGEAEKREFTFPEQYQAGDLIELYKNGLKLLEEEYSLTETAAVLNNSLKPGNTLEMVVTKAEIGAQQLNII